MPPPPPPDATRRAELQEATLLQSTTLRLSRVPVESSADYRLSATGGCLPADPLPPKDFTSVRACVRVCIRMLGAVLMHLAGRGRTAECPAVCERHCLMQLRTVLLTNATASLWGSRIRETHRPACRSLRGYWNVKVHRARQALEELPAQQWPWEETRVRKHTHPDTWRACHECEAGVTWLARQAA